jgi:hypothetical protein
MYLANETVRQWASSEVTVFVALAILGSVGVHLYLRE